MTWKGAFRSLAVAARRAERESKRRQRELESRQKEIAKMEVLAQASYEVELYENRLALLTSIHKDCGDKWNWEKIKNTLPPLKPSKSHINEEAALSNIENYKPSVSDKIFGRIDSKRTELLNEVENAREQDDREYEEALKTYEEKHSEWQETRELAARILDGDTEAYIEAIEQINPFGEISELGSAISFDAINRSLIDCTIKVNSEKVIPSEVKSLLKSGRLSVKQMPKSQFYQLYQDYVCACVFRVARELSSLLPIQIAIISASGKSLNTSTGFLEEKSVLSVIIPVQTLNELNFDMIDPSDALKNFIHRMSFKKTEGFNAVEKLTHFDIKLPK